MLTMRRFVLPAIVIIGIGTLFLGVADAGRRKSQGTCLGKWMRQAGIPGRYVSKYERSLRLVRMDEKNLRGINIHYLSYFLRGNFRHAQVLHMCVARKMKRCRSYNSCRTGGYCAFSRKRKVNVCRCREGLKGDLCHKDCNECRGDCGLQNNCHRSYGKCYNTHGSFKCGCKAGFTGNGVNCMDINECANGRHNCHGNATCTNTIGSYTCSCKVGFKGNGLVCKDICECCSSPCQNGGTCIEKVNGYSCHCAVGYDGVNCQSRWLVMHKHKALPEIVSNLTREVQSLSGRTLSLGGKLKKLKASACSQFPCVGGNCVPVGKTYKCVCSRQYYGARCENRCPTGARYSTAQKKCVCYAEGYAISGGSCVKPQECRTFATLTNFWRHTSRRSSYVGAHCDNSITPGWYRFYGAAGSEMATTCQAQGQCGTSYPMYMRGGHPSLAQGVTKRTVCGRYSGHCCYFSHSIKVRKCPGGFYIYYLPGNYGWCNAAYCGTG